MSKEGWLRRWVTATVQCQRTTCQPEPAGKFWGTAGDCSYAFSSSSARTQNGCGWRSFIVWPLLNLIKTTSNLARNTDFWCVIELKTVGMCAELPAGAFRASGGFHCRCRRQRLLLSQSPDLTCRCVILQCLRWQRSLTIYGETVSPKCSISSLVWVFFQATWMFYLLVYLFVTSLYFLTGCDKLRVSREKRLPCTSIRNHSSGEGTFVLYFTNQDIFKCLYL